MTRAKHMLKVTTLRHHPKVVKVVSKSRLWCEITSCGAVAYETHLLLLTVVSVLWVIVDVAVIILGVSEEL